MGPDFQEKTSEKSLSTLIVVLDGHKWPISNRDEAADCPTVGLIWAYLENKLGN